MTFPRFTIKVLGLFGALLGTIPKRPLWRENLAFSSVFSGERGGMVGFEGK
jgi:hypothetical protein